MISIYKSFAHQPKKLNDPQSAEHLKLEMALQLFTDYRTPGRPGLI